MKTRPYEDGLTERLVDPKYAAEYIKAVAEDGNPRVFAGAIGDVVKAHGGISKMARAIGANRPNLQNNLAGKGNPSLAQISEVLGYLGLSLTVARKPKRKVA